MSTVLIADDEHAICQAFAQMLSQAGHRALIAASGAQALALLAQEPVDAVFLDVRMPGLDGLTVLERIRAAHPGLPVIVMTAYGTVDTAMRALALGAFDYLGKPLDLAQVRTLLTRALHRPALAGPVADAADAPTGEAPLLGQSAPMQEVFKLLALLAENDLPVLITGESGVGKELVARAIHRYSRRAGGPFVAVNCAAIPETLLESELFGHERGAFTGAAQQRIGRCEAAADGVLFLDEIAELPLPLQAKLLRLLQERQFERVGGSQPLPLAARVLAATNRNLEEAIAAGQFRRDLYHRLNLVNLRLPPLRERRDDIAPLTAHFLRQAAQELGKAVPGIEPAALQRLQAHPWPGNVRELEHLIKRAVLTARGAVLTIHDLDLPAVAPPATAAEAPRAALDAAARAALRAAVQPVGPRPDQGLFHHLVGLVETALIDEALRLSSGNQVTASRLLGLHRSTLRSRLPGRGSG